MNASSLNVILKQLAISNGLKKELEDLIGPQQSRIVHFLFVSSVNIHVSPPVNRSTSIIPAGFIVCILVPVLYIHEIVLISYKTTIH